MDYIDPLDPLQRNRLSHLFIQYGSLEVVDGAFVLSDAVGARVQIPVANISVLFLEPGTTVTHAAVMLACASGVRMIWVGEAGTRIYGAGQPTAGDIGRLLQQVHCHEDAQKRLEVVHRMYRLRFKSEIPSRRSVEQLRGIEGARVKALYQTLARAQGVVWKGRRYDPKDWDSADLANRALSAANACMHGLCEAVLVACGYSSALGFIHTGGVRSFVYDIADLYKMELCAPLAFELASTGRPDVETVIRRRLRDEFRKVRLVDQIVRDTDALFEGLAS